MAEAADPLIGLHGLRTLDPTLADGLGALALGLLIAATVFGLWGLRPRVKARSAGPAARLQAARALPPDERIVALAGLLRDLTDRHAPGPDPWTARAVRHFHLPADSFAVLGPALYRRGAPLSAQTLDRAAEMAVARLGA